MSLVSEQPDQLKNYLVTILICNNKPWRWFSGSGMHSEHIHIIQKIYIDILDSKHNFISRYHLTTQSIMLLQIHHLWFCLVGLLQFGRQSYNKNNYLRVFHIWLYNLPFLIRNIKSSYFLKISLTSMTIAQYPTNHPVENIKCRYKCTLQYNWEGAPLYERVGRLCGGGVIREPLGTRG